MAATPPDVRTAFARTLAAGLLVSLLAGAGVWAVARQRLGATSADARARVEAQVQQRVDATDARLAKLTAGAAAQASTVRGAARDSDAARRLFDALASTVPADERATAGISIYDVTSTPLAWAGRVVDLPRERLERAPAEFMAADALGPRLVRITPIVERTSAGTAQRVGVAVAEELVANIDHALGVPVAVAPGAREGHTPQSFAIHSPGGAVLASATVMDSDLDAARARWMRIAGGAILAVLDLMLLACTAPVLEWRRRTRRPVRLAMLTALLFAMVVGVGVLADVTLTAVVGRTAAQPYRLLTNALTLAAAVWLALDLAERRRLGRPRLLLGTGAVALASTALLHFAAGSAAATIAVACETFVRRFVNAAGLDLLHFSLHPLSAARTAISFALLLLYTGAIWAGAFALRLAALASRRPRGTRVTVAAGAAMLAGAVTAGAFAGHAWGGIPLAPVALVFATMALCAAALSRPRGAFRRASQGARLALLYLALLAPALAFYPSLTTYVASAKERLIAATFAPEAMNLRQDLQRQSDRTIEQIDAMHDLPSLVEARGETATTDQAFEVWSRTALAEHRITSAIELYSASGRLVSRFSLNLPEYSSALRVPPGCRWTTFEEVTSFAATDRHVLRASRAICTPAGVAGTIVVRVMLDYRTLPFIASQRPDIEAALAENERGPGEATLGRDVEFVIYGWSQAPLYSFSNGIWPLEPQVFDRLVRSRTPFWATVERGDGVGYRVYFASDRGGIYALGYPVVTVFGHLVNLAELVVLTFVLWVALVGGATIFNAVTVHTPVGGRALLREVRSSFYRKLWLAFIGAAAVPVLILAFATRTYFANQFDASVKDDAVRTATVAQRLVEDYAAFQPRQTGSLEALDDELMILVSQAIDQDVNLFDPKRLQATSEPELFASGVLPLRTPDDVYRAVALDRLPAFVGYEAVGRASYLLAAARVRAGQREGIVTVPLTTRAREGDQQIDNLDRRVLFASVLFVMLGAAVGYWMAERIADPVSRLTRATRRIARGELDVRVAATSSDELRRLVQDFNRMAADLQRQRAELERTQRLEAWADMARQVAHDIKNPLTPIQLSAEHARRVNADRGRPLSPVLDECVNAILTQVKLLRQIAAEFSSFASSPTARPEPTDVAALVDEVVEPYRAGLAGRVTIDVRRGPGIPHVSIDRNLFARALTNLIENALFAMPGGGTLTVATSVAPAHAAIPRGRGAARDQLVVTVSDTGTGMDQEALKRIFEPYFSTKTSGTGLGLTIAKRNVELNGGTIEVESERGVGTTVRIVLPVGEDGGDGGNGITRSNRETESLE